MTSNAHPLRQAEEADPLRELSSLEHALASVDFFEQAVVVNHAGDLIAALGPHADTLRTLAACLSGITSIAREVLRAGGEESCEFVCDGRTYFGVHTAGLFALVAPTRRSITRERLEAIRQILISGAD
jgi:hypothetical protein